MSTRRTILRGIIGSLAASVYALAGGPTTSTAAAAQQGDRQWFEESLSGTRDATQEERDYILPDLHNRVIEAGHPSETVDVAATGVTASVSSRGTMARIKQNGILGQLLRDSWLAFTEGLL